MAAKLSVSVAEVVVQMRAARAAVVGFGLVTCLLTAGCTPAPLGTAGVLLDEGYPTVLIRPCPGIAVNQVWVYERAADLRWGTADSGQNPVTAVRLLRAPAGWAEPDVAVVNQLVALSPSAVYQVQLSTDHPERGGIDLVEFTLGDLTSDKVWATKPHGQPQVMTRDEFDKQAARNC
jgi:hypothetical protein